mgnify:CR=1 FL=1
MVIIKTTFKYNKLKLKVNIIFSLFHHQKVIESDLRRFSWKCNIIFNSFSIHFRIVQYVAVMKLTLDCDVSHSVEWIIHANLFNPFKKMDINLVHICKLNCAKKQNECVRINSIVHTVLMCKDVIPDYILYRYIYNEKSRNGNRTWIVNFYEILWKLYRKILLGRYNHKTQIKYQMHVELS